MIKRSHQKFLRKADLGVTDMELWDLYDKDGNQTIEITDMELSRIAEYAELFVSVFNAEPWNDSWTKETAQIRIENMMKTGTFIGKEFCPKICVNSKSRCKIEQKILFRGLSPLSTL